MSGLYDLAYEKRYKKIAERISAHPSEVEFQCKGDGNTPLHMLAYNNAPLEYIKAVVEARRGVVQIKNNENNTPLDMAIENNGSQGVVEYLTEMTNKEKAAALENMPQNLHTLQSDLEGLKKESDSSATKFIRLTNVVGKLQKDFLAMKAVPPINPEINQRTFKAEQCTENLEKRIARIETKMRNTQMNAAKVEETNEIDEFVERKKQIKMKQDLALDQKNLLKSSDEMKSLRSLVENMISALLRRDADRVSKEKKLLERQISSLKTERLVLLKFKNGGNLEFNALKDENDVMLVRQENLELSVMEMKTEIKSLRQSLEDRKNELEDSNKKNPRRRHGIGVNVGSIIKETHEGQLANGVCNEGENQEQFLENLLEDKETLQNEVSYWKAERIVLLNYRHGSELERRKMWKEIKIVGKKQKAIKRCMGRMTTRSNRVAPLGHTGYEKGNNFQVAQPHQQFSIDKHKENYLLPQKDVEAEQSMPSKYTGVKNVKLISFISQQPRSLCASKFMRPINEGEIAKTENDLSREYEKLKIKHAHLLGSEEKDDRSVRSKVSLRSELNSMRSDWNSSISAISEEVGSATALSSSEKRKSGQNGTFRYSVVGGTEDMTLSRTPMAKKGSFNEEKITSHHRPTLELELEKLWPAQYKSYSGIDSGSTDERSVRSKNSLRLEVESIRSYDTPELGSGKFLLRKSSHNSTSKGKRLTLMRKLLSAKRVPKKLVAEEMHSKKSYGKKSRFA